MNIRRNTPPPLSSIDALILCGGQGTRLRPVVSNHPKCLAPIAGRPILDLLIDNLVGQGVQRIIFCVGHLGEQIIAYYKTRKDAEFLFSIEKKPLGTGGAVQNALKLVHHDPFLVLNGDSICYADFSKLLNIHYTKKAGATMVLVEPNERNDGGLVRLDTVGRIVSFLEKSTAEKTGKCYLNAGIYLLRPQHVADLLPSFSLEHEVFPRLIAGGECFGLVVPGGVMDIGTPERYRAANFLYSGLI